MITLTEAASNYIKKLLAQKSPKAEFRLSLKKTGCSGFSYAPEIVETPSAEDVCVETNGMKIYIDHRYVDYLREISVDYREESSSVGLKQKRLLFTNPNEQGRCGCGESFHIE